MTAHAKKADPVPAAAGGMWDPLPVPSAPASDSNPNLATVQPSAPVPEQLLRIPLDQIHESPLNPRQHYDQGSLEQLMDSLLQTGQLTPVLVRPRPKGGYELGAGHRRRRAALLAVERHPEGADYRGLRALLAIVRDLDDRAFIETLQVENLQRDDLHPLEEADGFRTLMERAGYDVAKIAARIGRSTRYVYDSLTLLKLIPKAKKLFLADGFERGHAIELARLAPTDQERAIDPDNRAGNGRLDGLFVPELVDDGGFDLKDQPKKPVTVREFKHWIDDQVRFKPAAADPVLFPATVQAVTAAGAAKEKVIEITYDFQLPEAARLDGAPRVYGAQAWRSATKGIPDPQYGGKDSGKPCDHAITGVVVIGERRGEAFKVCIAKEQCAVHWADWQKERQRVAKDRASDRSDRIEARRQRDQEDWKARQAREEAERKRYEKAAPKVRAALTDKIATLAVKPGGPIAQLVVGRVVQGWGGTPKAIKAAQTTDALLRALAQYVADGALESSSYGAADRWSKLGKPFGVDVKKIVDEVAPPEPKPPAKKSAGKKPTPQPKKGAKR